VTLTVTDDENQTDTASTEIKVGTPKAGFELSPPVGVVPVEVSFNASNSFDIDGDVLSWNWDFGDGEIGTGETASHEYAAPGTFTVTLTVEDDDALTDTASAEVRVIEPGFPVANAGPDQSVGCGNMIFLDGSGSHDTDPGGTLNKYYWTRKSGPYVFIPNKRVKRSLVKPPSECPTTLVFELAVTDDDGNEATDQVTVRVEDGN